VQPARPAPPLRLVLPQDVPGANSVFGPATDERSRPWREALRRRGWVVRTGDEVAVAGGGDGDLVLDAAGAVGVHVAYAVPDVTAVDAAVLLGMLERRSAHSPTRLSVLAGPAAVDATEALGLLGLLPSDGPAGPAAAGPGAALARAMKASLEGLASLRRTSVDRGCADAAAHVEWAAARSAGPEAPSAEDLRIGLRRIGVVVAGYDDALAPPPAPAAPEQLAVGVAAGAAVAVVQGALRTDPAAEPRLADLPGRDLVGRLVRGRGAR
jgi:hypothetical protein